MTIRKAKPEEAPAISPLLLLAMEAIFFEFTGVNSTEKATAFLNKLVAQPENQYSYENCWVVEIDKKIAGVACVYDGAKLHALRAPVSAKIKTKFNKDFNPEDETQAGEIYIDCAGVHPEYQGQGIGSALFHFLIEEYVKKQGLKLGLLVDDDNPNAKRLYLKLGFQVVGKKTLAGKTLEHLQL